MNKGDFVSYIANKHSCTKAEAERVIDMFTSSVIGALGKGEEVSLVGFGNYSVTKVAARAGRNPRTGETLTIESKNSVKFKAGKELAAKM